MRVVRHGHTGRRLPMHYTSYAFLFFLLVLTGATLLFTGHSVRADQQIKQGDIGLTGLVPGPPPANPANITDPSPGSHFSTNTITVKGTCQVGLLVELFRYSSFAGSTICKSDGTFQLIITLLPGQNDLRARQSDSLSQYAPDSVIITVFYDVPINAASPTRTPTNPSAPVTLLIYTSPVQRGTVVNRPLKLKYQINGGTPAYAVSVNWDDGTESDLASLDKAGEYTANHTYTKAGQNTVSIAASDRSNNRAFIQTIAIINQAGPAAGTTKPASCGASDQNSVSSSVVCYVNSRVVHIIDTLWPAFLVACLMTASFWFGERVVYTRLRRA